MSNIPDPVREGLARGWPIHGGSFRAIAPTLERDVAIVGSGAGITAELLTQARLDVVIIEEGPLKSSSDFHERESAAYPALYQESAGRKTADKAINILQGRCVGGSTTVNWTSSFRTPPATLGRWREKFSLHDLTEQLAPWFAQAEARLSIGPWLTPPNENNDLLRHGASKLAIEASAIRRNVKGCWNLGSCGMGCPTNAKQAMLVTTLPAALDRRARLLVQTRAQRFELEQGRVKSLLCASASDGSDDGSAASHHRASLRDRQRRHQLAGIAAAFVGARFARPPRQTHLPALGSHFVRAVRAAGGRLVRRAADHLHRPLPARAADRRPDRLQDRGTAAASADLRVDAHRLRPGASRAAGAAPAHTGAARAACAAARWLSAARDVALV